MTGLAVAMLAVTFTAPVLTVSEQSQSLQADQPAADDDSSETTVIKAFDAITSTIQIHLTQAFLLIEILPDQEVLVQEPGEDQESITAASKVFKVLFRRIISPNAP